MDGQSNGGRPQPTGQAFNAETSHSKKVKKNKDGFLSMKTVMAVLLVGVAVLIIAVIAYAINNNVKPESGYVSTSDYQAVFVNVAGSSGGQAYFGHIKSINNQYIELSNVFYLEPGSTNNQFTLNNLSCALYNPNDTMIIKSDQVAFWENLKSNSQVTSDINKWYTDNLQCSSNKSAASTTPTTTGTTTTGSSTSTGTTTTKP